MGDPFRRPNLQNIPLRTAEVDVRKKITTVVSDDVNRQKNEENKIINDIKSKEQELLAESKRAKEGIPEDPLDTYTTQRVKYAQLIWTYKKTEERMEEMRKIIKSTRDILNDMDEESPEFLEQYREKYYKARTDAGLPEDDGDTFMQYLGKDVELDF